MEKKVFWPVLAAYLKARYRVMVGFVLFLLLFWLLFFLLRLPYDAVLYGSAVSPGRRAFETAGMTFQVL